jgi:hypothetical protein
VTSRLISPCSPSHYLQRTCFVSQPPASPSSLRLSAWAPLGLQSSTSRDGLCPISSDPIASLCVDLPGLALISFTGILIPCPYFSYPDWLSSSWRLNPLFTLDVIDPTRRYGCAFPPISSPDRRLWMQSWPLPRSWLRFGAKFLCTDHPKNLDFLTHSVHYFLLSVLGISLLFAAMMKP